MRILHLYKDYFPVLGGIEIHIQQLAEAQTAAGHDVAVLVCSLDSHTTDTVENGVRVIRAARLATLASAPLSLAFPWRLHALQADIAHLQAPYPLAEVSQWLLGRARATVITYQSDIVRQKGILRFYAPLLRRVLKAADRVVATAPQYLASSPFLQAVADKVQIVPMGLPVQRFVHADPVQVAAIQAKYPEPRLLFVGKLRYYKGLQYLLQALPAIPAANLLVAGDGPMGPEWKQIAQEAGVASRVHWLGDVADEAYKAALYHAADLFVLPSCERSEAFGLVQVEAMAAGRAVVCTELGTGTSYVNQNGVTGIVVPARDSRALAEAINRLLAEDALRAQMGQAGQARALREFDLPRMVERVEGVYREVLRAKEDGRSKIED